MPRTPVANAQLAYAQRERILDAAAVVFARKGLAGGRVTDVAARAGLSHGLVHHYFGSKADLHRALVERTMAGADALPRAARERPGTAWERLAWYVETALMGARFAPEQFFLVAETTMNETVDPAVRDLVEKKGAEGRALLAALVADAQAEGTARAGDPHALATHVLAAVTGLAVSRVGDGIDTDIVLGLLRARPEAP